MTPVHSLQWRHNGRDGVSITSLTSVYSNVYLGVDQRKHQSSASLAFVRGIHRSPVNSPYKWPVTRKMFPFDDVIMWSGGAYLFILHWCHLATKITGNSTACSTASSHQQHRIHQSFAVALSDGKCWDIVNWTLGTRFSEMLIEICTFPFKKMHVKMSAAQGGNFVSASMC